MRTHCACPEGRLLGGGNPKADHATYAVRRCVNCRGAHASSSRECPQYLREKEIAIIKTRDRITYREASRLYNAALQQSNRSNTYARLTARPPLVTISSVATQTDPVSLPCSCGKEVNFPPLRKLSAVRKVSTASQTVSKYLDL